MTIYNNINRRIRYGQEFKAEWVYFEHGQGVRIGQSWGRMGQSGLNKSGRGV